MKIDDINMDEAVQVCRAVAIAYNTLAPLFNLTQRNEDSLTYYLNAGLIKVLNALPDDK